MLVGEVSAPIAAVDSHCVIPGLPPFTQMLVGEGSAPIAAVDRFGNSPLDEARRAGAQVGEAGSISMFSCDIWDAPHCLLPTKHHPPLTLPASDCGGLSRVQCQH